MAKASGPRKGKAVSKRSTIALNVRVKLIRDATTPDEEVPTDAVLYAFGTGGELLDSAPISDMQSGRAKLALPDKAKGRSVQLIVGPPMMKDADDTLRECSLTQFAEAEMKSAARGMAAQLTAKGAYSKRVILTKKQDNLELAIAPDIWTQWYWCSCVVRGRLVKQYTLPDGSTQMLGVCYACVYIYEVDQVFRVITKLPDDLIRRLREDLIRVIDKWPPPPPWPPRDIPELVGPDLPEPPGPLPEDLHGIRQIAKVDVMKDTAPMMGAMDASGTDPMIRQALISDLKPILSAASPTQIRKAMVENVNVILPYLCPITWLHGFFEKQFITCACTDENGYFEKTIFYPCLGDKPDLYFTARQYINGMGCVMLYEPPIACNTYWNYSCGTEVLLQTTEPAARVCVPGDQPPDPEPGHDPWVMPFGIGGIRVDKIKSTGFVDAHGKTDAPWAKTLGFRHQYSTGTSSAVNGKPYYYRWQYKKDGTSQWRELTATIVRHYVHQKPGELPIFPACKIGPWSVAAMNLYRFRPPEPEECADVAPYNAATDDLYWPPETWFNEIYTGLLNTISIPGGVDGGYGRYKVKLTVYDHQGTRLSPNLGGGGAFEFIVPDGPMGPTMTPRAALPTEIEDDGYIFYIHVDNRRCTAAIDAPSITGTGPADLCGFLRYDDPTNDVLIAFEAKQPGDHATCRFYIKRSNTVLDFTHAAGEVDDTRLVEVGSSPATNVYDNTVGDTGRFTEDFTASNLLGTCVQAAYTEVLDVEAKATNGWRRIDEYDASTVRAFALAPEEESAP